MGRPKSNNVQVNITIPMEWKIELENLVRIYSVEDGETITFLDHMRKFNKKKRFGKSIKNRCPSGFQATVDEKFKTTGGTYIEVPNDYRASQYDHTADDYIKKKLSDRMYHLADGTLVQQDWYSSFLLYCYDYVTKNIGRDRCISEFEKCYSKEEALIKRIETNRIKVLNSGIKIA